MILLSLGKVSTGVHKNAVARFELSVAENMVPSRFPVWVEELLVQVEGLFSMPAVSSISIAAVSTWNRLTGSLCRRVIAYGDILPCGKC